MSRSISISLSLPCFSESVKIVFSVSYISRKTKYTVKLDFVPKVGNFFLPFVSHHE